MKKILIVFCLLASSVTLMRAQEKNAGAPGGETLEIQKSEMRKIDSMVGQWTGEGWIQQGAKRSEFSGTENVQRKLEGLALLVEGRFTDKVDSTKVIHQTLAVLNYNPKNGNFDFSTFLANGARGVFPFRASDASFEWGMDFPGSKILYTITIKDGVWNEVGKMSRDDGKNWFQFFEMNLRKQ